MFDFQFHYYIVLVCFYEFQIVYAILISFDVMCLYCWFELCITYVCVLLVSFLIFVPRPGGFWGSNMLSKCNETTSVQNSGP